MKTSMACLVTLFLLLGASTAHAGESATGLAEWISWSAEKLQALQASACDESVLEEAQVRCEAELKRLTALEAASPADRAAFAGEIERAKRGISGLEASLRKPTGLARDLCGKGLARTRSCVAQVKVELVVLGAKTRAR
jgi:hypothetical protein